METRVQPGPTEPVSERSLVNNDLLLNSATLNGWSLNGFRTNGWSLNGWSLNGWSLNNVQLVGSTFGGVKMVNGQEIPLFGEELIGAELSLSNGGQPFTLRFDNIFIDPANPQGDVYFHSVSVLDPQTNTWSSLCRDTHGEPTEAIALRHHWNPTTGARITDNLAVTLACRGAALAKCVEWGYRPWATVQSCTYYGGCTQVNLADHHQACTRMARADYCGDGVPHTLNNTPIDVYDRLSPRIQKLASADNKEWKVEAEWGPDGALCLGKQLRVDMFAQLGVSHAMPACRKALTEVKDCGKFPASRAATSKLGNNYCPKWKTDPKACSLTLGDDDEDDDDNDD